MEAADAKAVIARRLRTQGKECASLSSPLYAELLEQAAADVERGGVVWRVLEGHEGDPGPSALALRLLGAVHRLVLSGEAPALAARYPSAGGDGDVATTWEPFAALLEDRFDEVRSGVERPVQTNEVRRCAALLGGFLEVAATTGLPLRVLEGGASGGLNLRWDHYGYRQDDAAWGDPASPVQLVDPWRDGLPRLDVRTEVVERAGCDASPVDVTTEEGRLTLRSFVWPDQLHRHEMLAAAFDVAARVDASVEQADLPVWLEQRLAEPVPGVATVVFHSVVIQYLPPEGRQRTIEVIEEAGRRATADAPLAWLRMEPSREERGFLLELTQWPHGGGEHRRLARCSGHGPPIYWVT